MGAVRARRSARQRFGTVAVSGIRPRPPRSAAGTRAVKTAMAANSAIMCVKGVAAVVTGSGSMMSEAIHSAVDVMNQGLLAIGLARGNQPANLKNPYGFGHEMYAFSMLAGVGTFFLGSGVQGLPHERPRPHQHCCFHGGFRGCLWGDSGRWRNRTDNRDWKPNV